jgi:hypothetical protein
MASSGSIRRRAAEHRTGRAAVPVVPDEHERAVGLEGVASRTSPDGACETMSNTMS